jgi:hypothetical protein
MKKMLLGAMLLSATVAFASGTSVDDTQEAIGAALVEFKQTQTHEVVDAFNGIKAWPVTGGIKAKVYVKGSDAISYSCHRHDVQDPFECHETN